MLHINTPSMSPFHCANRKRGFLLLLTVLFCFVSQVQAQNINYYFRHNFFGPPDLLRDMGPGFGYSATPYNYFVYLANNVTGNGEQIRLGHRQLNNGNLTAVWVGGTNLQIGRPENFTYFGSFNIPSRTLARYVEFPTEGYSYLFKIEARGNESSRGILMEFDRNPALKLEYFSSDNFVQVGVNTPLNGMVQLGSGIAGGQFFYVRYRHSNDPVNQYQWTPVTFPVSNGRYGYFSLPAFFFTGTVEMTLMCKNKPISSFTDNSYTDNIYDVPFVSGSTITTSIVSNPPTTVNTEFTVNMTGQSVSPEGVFMSLFNNVTGSRRLRMTNVGNNVYKTTVKLRPDEEVQFVYINGIVSEIVPTACRGLNTSARKFTPSTAQPSPIPVCFSACNTSCAGNSSTVNVTFRVNASGATISPAGVKLAGSFNNFSLTATPMTLVGNNVYQATVPLTIGELVTYKFVNGNTFETIPPGCAINNGTGNFNRFLSVPNTTTTLPAVCFNACNDACAAPAPTIPVTFRVNMSGQTIAAGGIKLAGSFNGFSTSANAMTPVGNNVYETTVSIPASSTIQYKFVNGTSFELIAEECGINDGGGNINRLLQVGTTALTLNTVCFSSCTNSCATTPPVNVTFRVNMTGQTVSPTGVYLAGSFNNFSTTATPMTLVGSNVYQAVVPLVPGTTNQYKFVNGSDFELIGSTCGIDDGGGNINRFLTIPPLPITLNTVCFNRCNNSCATTVATTAVTFRVNMTGQNISSAGVKLAGSFNGFSTTANPMTERGGNLYEATVDLPVNSTFTYKFVNGNNFELVTVQCGVNDGNGNINRTVTTASLAEQLVPAVCFGSCSDCNRSQITFRVDLGTVPASPSGVFLAGSFNEFSTTASPMIKVGPSTYEATLPLVPGSQVTYKFVNGTNFELITSECGIMGGATVYDRLLTVPASNSALGMVCFNSCNNCVATSVTDRTESHIRLYPNPTNGILLLGKPVTATYRIVDLTGRIVHNSSARAALVQQINVTALPPGLYFIQILEKDKTPGSYLFKKE